MTIQLWWSDTVVSGHGRMTTANPERVEKRLMSSAWPWHPKPDVTGHGGQPINGARFAGHPTRITGANSHQQQQSATLFSFSFTYIRTSSAMHKFRLPSFLVHASIITLQFEPFAPFSPRDIQFYSSGDLPHQVLYNSTVNECSLSLVSYDSKLMEQIIHRSTVFYCQMTSQ